MNTLSSYLEAGETLGKPEVGGEDQQNPDYLLYPVTKDGRGQDDRVLIDIKTSTNPVVLVGGNALRIETLRGLGSLTTIDLSKGEKMITDLNPGDVVDIPIGGVHWYNSGGDLLIRDTSLNFDLANEVNLQSFVQALIDVPTRHFR